MLCLRFKVCSSRQVTVVCIWSIARFATNLPELHWPVDIFKTVDVETDVLPAEAFLFKQLQSFAGPKTVRFFIKCLDTPRTKTGGKKPVPFWLKTVRAEEVTHLGRGTKAPRGLDRSLEDVSRKHRIDYSVVYSIQYVCFGQRKHL